MQFGIGGVKPGTAPMSSELQTIDITNSAELLDLAEEVYQSGVGRLLKRGEQELAMLTPVTPRLEAPPASHPAEGEQDAILSIIGIGASTEPTDIALRG